VVLFVGSDYYFYPLIMLQTPQLILNLFPVHHIQVLLIDDQLCLSVLLITVLFGLNLSLELISHNLSLLFQLILLVPLFSGPQTVIPIDSL